MKTVTVSIEVDIPSTVDVEMTVEEVMDLYEQVQGRAGVPAHETLAKFLLESIDHPLNGWLDTAATTPLDSVLVPTTWLERLRDALRDWTEATQ